MKKKSINEKIKDLKEKYPDADSIIAYSELNEMGLRYEYTNRLLQDGVLQKVRNGVYRLTGEDISEAKLIQIMYPDGIICMYTALFHYGYSDRTLSQWDLAIGRNTSKNRFNISYPAVQPYFIDEKHLTYGIIETTISDANFKIFDCNRLICEVIKNENKMAKESYNKAIQGYIKDSNKNINYLLEYAKKRNNYNRVLDRIGVWL